MEFDYLLPIGTVVKLKGGKKRLMVFGIKQMQKLNENDSSKEYDYIGVLYPEGNLGAKSQFLFNHEDIEVVYYRGFEDIERQKFIESLNKLSKKHSNIE